MNAIRLITHLFVPHESNNQKAKILHSSSLFVLAILVIGFQVALNIFPKAFPKVLGYAANISPAEVIRLTNVQRTANGLLPVSENSNLDSAALAKGNDMLAKGYWAHFAPDGTSPWSFFLNFGYKYKYAGENLARDFGNANDAVNAWMNSPTHKENILNPNYRDIGIGVVEGNLAGVNTTIIVQFFGSPLSAAPVAVKVKEQAQPIVFASPTPRVAAVISTPTPVPIPAVTPTPYVVSELRQATSGALALFSPFTSSKDVALGITGLVLLVLLIDLIVVRRRRIVRIGGRTFAHIAYFAMILAVIIILKAGRIM